MSALETQQRRVALGAAGLVALFAAGLVLASSWLISYDAAVLLAAWLVALAGMTAVVVVAFRQARAAKTGFSGALGRGLKAMWQFILAFF